MNYFFFIATAFGLGHPSPHNPNGSNPACSVTFVSWHFVEFRILLVLNRLSIVMAALAMKQNCSQYATFPDTQITDARIVNAFAML